MLIHPEERVEFVLPYDDYAPLPPELEEPAKPTAAEIIARMTEDAHQTCELVGKRAAMAIVIAIGNYEFMSFNREEIITAAEALLDEIDESDKETHRWGP